MAYVSETFSSVTSGTAVKIASAPYYPAEVKIRPTVALVIGGRSDNTTYPINASTAEVPDYEFDLGTGEELWAKAASSTGDVHVLSNGR